MHEKKNNESRVWYWIPLSLMFLLLALLLGGAAYYAFVSGAAWGTTVVPDLVGSGSIEEAREIAGDQLEVVEGNQVEGHDALGTIVAQDSQAGETVSEGSTISLDVVGTRIADLPNVEGETSEDAEQALEEAGFEVDVETEESSAEDEGYVIEQDSRGGETAEVGSTVTITVGEVPANVEVPDVYDYANPSPANQTQAANNQVPANVEVPGVYEQQGSPLQEAKQQPEYPPSPYPPAGPSYPSAGPSYPPSPQGGGSY
jgi:serine/threonine-protein kinase